MTASKWGKGFVALLAVAVMVTFVGGMLVLVLNSGSDDEVAAPVVTTQPEEQPPATEAPATTVAPGRVDTSDGRGDATISEDCCGLYPGDIETIPLPPMGIAATNFEWTVTELDASTGHGEAWISSLVEIDGELWAVGGAYEESIDGERSFVYRSTDGVTWETAELPAGIGDGGHAQFTATEAGVVAVVQKWEEGANRSQLRAFVTVDGSTWNETDLAAFSGPGQNMWINQVAGSGNVIVMVGNVEQVPEPGEYQPPVIVIEHGGYIVELDEETWSFEVKDAVTGEAVARGSQEVLWMHDEEGRIGIYDGAELIFPLGWEDLDRAGVKAHEEVQWGDRLEITVTKDDKTLTLDGYTGAVVVADSSGAILFEGAEQDLWQGPPPTFRDALGEVIVSIPWEVWNAAHQEAYSTFGGEGFSYRSDPVMLRTTDGGVTWESVDTSAFAGEGFYFQSLAGGRNGFIAIGTQEPVFAEEAARSSELYQPPAPTILTSGDGSTWVLVASDLPAGDWMHSMIATADEFLAVRGGEAGTSTVVGSADGSSWTTTLSDDDLKLELGQVWFNQIYHGGLGTFVTGTYDGWTEPDYVPATISRDGRNLTVDGAIYTVTDAASGEVLFTLDESEYWVFEEEGFGPPSTGFKWGQGGLAMFDDDGGVIFAVSHRQWEEAMQAMWEEPGVYYETEQVVLYRDGGSWTQVPMPDLEQHTWISGAVVTDTAVILTATSETHSERDFSIKNLVLVGVPAG